MPDEELQKMKGLSIEELSEYFGVPEEMVGPLSCAGIREALLPSRGETEGGGGCLLRMT